MPRSKQSQAASLSKSSESPQDALADVLRRMLLATRCKGMGGTSAPYMADRCIACDRPHGTNRPCSCPHHDAIHLLETLGVEIA
jgi:hypothetical protein